MQVSMFSSGLDSMQSANRRMQQAATEIAGATLPSAQQTAGINAPNPAVVPAEAAIDPSDRADLSSKLLALELSKVEAQTGAKLIETADEVLGTLIDTSA